jgi:hypothetical protein
MPMRCPVLAVLLGLGSTAVTWAQVPAGGEFRVNTYTNGYQISPLVAVAPGGAFMAVWDSGGQDGSSTGVFAQRYDASGAPQGGEFRVNTTTSGTQSIRYGGAVADAAGNYIVVWFSSGPGQDGSGRGVVGRVFAPSGAPLTGEFLVNVFTAGRQTSPAVAAQPGGNFVVVWESANQDGSSYGVFGRRFNGGGVPLSGEFPVNVFVTGAQRAARVAADAAGNFVVVWMSDGQDGSQTGVFGRRFNASAAPIGGEFQVNVFTSNHQEYPVVAAAADGRFVVAWESGSDIADPVPTQDGNRFGIFARRYNASGVALTGDVQMNVYTTDHQHTPTVAALGNGSFVAAWYSQDQLGSNNTDTFARYVDGAGVPGPEFRVNTFTAGNQFLAMADADGSGNLLFVWDSVGQDGSLDGIYAQRYRGDVIFADGFQNE